MSMDVPNFSQQLLYTRYIFNPLQGDFREGTLELDFLERGDLEIYFGQGGARMKTGDLFVAPSHKSLWLRPAANGKEQVYIFQVRISLRALPQELLSLSAGNNVRQFLHNSARGILYRSSSDIKLLKDKFQKAVAQEGWGQLVAVLDLMGHLSLLPGGLSVSLFSILYAKLEKKRQDTLVGRIDEYLKSHFSESIRLEQLIPLCGLTPTSICRLYKERTGQTIWDRLGWLRVQRACELLDDTDMSVKQIAMGQGYVDAVYFSRLFRRVMHCSPLQYRFRKE